MSPDRRRGALELGYRLLPAWWGRGLAAEACAASRRLAARPGSTERLRFREINADQVLADRPLR